MFALFSLSPIEIIILGFLCLLPIGGLVVALIVISMTRSKQAGQKSVLDQGSAGVSLEDELHGLRGLVKVQQEEIAALKAQLNQQTEKQANQGSTDITA